MRKFCENQFCHNPGAIVVPVSVDGPSDQQRTLCATCEESYSLGVQQGTLSRSKPTPSLDLFLRKKGFVIIGRNQGDASKHGAIEAWAYEGPLDFDKAQPVVFGVGSCIRDSIAALDEQLAARRTSKHEIGLPG